MKYHVVMLVGGLFMAACATTPTAPAATMTPAAVAPATETPAAAVPTAPVVAATATTTTAAAASQTFVIDGSQSVVTYAVDEVFLSENRPYRPVGKTNAIEGEFVVSMEGAPSGQVTRMRVDLRTLTTDSSRRDNAIRSRWLESDTYPYADFVSTNALNLPTSYADGASVTFDLVGDMTIRDVTKSVRWQVTGVRTGTTVTGKATTVINMSDFGVNPPNIANMLKVEDAVTLEVTFVATARP